MGSVRTGFDQIGRVLILTKLRRPARRLQTDELAFSSQVIYSRFFAIVGVDRRSPFDGSEELFERVVESESVPNS